MGIKDYIVDLMQYFKTNELPRNFVNNEFRQLTNSVKSNDGYYICSVNPTELPESFLLMYMSNADDDWTDEGYYFAFHKDKIELVINNEDLTNYYEDATNVSMCTTKDEYFNLSLKYNFKISFEVLQFIHEEFSKIDSTNILKYSIYYGLGEEKLYGYDN